MAMEEKKARQGQYGRVGKQARVFCLKCAVPMSCPIPLQTTASRLIFPAVSDCCQLRDYRLIDLVLTVSKIHVFSSPLPSTSRQSSAGVLLTLLLFLAGGVSPSSDGCSKRNAAAAEKIRNIYQDGKKWFRMVKAGIWHRAILL